MPAIDATYLSEAAIRAFQRRQKLQELDTEGAHDRTDFAESVRRLGEQRVSTLQSTKEGANREGLFYSGQLGKRTGEVEKNFTRERGDQQRDFDRREQARTAARRAIEAGAPLEEAAALAASADRTIQRDSELAQANALAPNPAASAGAARPAAPRPPAKGRPAAVRRPVQQRAAQSRNRAVQQNSHAQAIARARRPRQPRR